MHEVPD